MPLTNDFIQHELFVLNQIYNRSRFFTPYQGKSVSSIAMSHLIMPFIDIVCTLTVGAVHLMQGIGYAFILRCEAVLLLIGLAELVTAALVPMLALAAIIGRSIASMVALTHSVATVPARVPAPAPAADLDADLDTDALRI
jgi:hypothetical protein